MVAGPIHSQAELYAQQGIVRQQAAIGKNVGQIFVDNGGFPDAVAVVLQ
jgi:hypothetical protein